MHGQHPPISRSLLASAILVTGLGAGPCLAADQDIDSRIEMLQRQIDELRRMQAEQAQQLEQARAEAGQAKAALKQVEAKGGPVWPEGMPKPSFGGQYRINTYVADEDTPPPGGDAHTAARLRIRQNIDLKFSDNLDTHLQLELRHTTGNTSVTNAGGGNPDARGSTTGSVGVRHAVIHYQTDAGTQLLAGILPLSDKFNDTLFSSDWDYNPLAVASVFRLGPGEARVGAAIVTDGISETNNRDDITQYQADYAWSMGGARLNLGLYVVDGPNVAAFGNQARHAGYLVNGGLGVDLPLSSTWNFKGFVLGGYTDRSLNPSNYPANSAALAADDGSGIALQGILGGKLGRGDLHLMASYASGDNDGTGFMPVMAVAGTQGYWGYTGLLTVQGPTDTAIDGDSINISNNGYGLATVQAKYTFPIMNKLDGYLGVGWFGATDAPGTRDDTVGIDGIAMLSYHFTRILALDFGVAAASLNDSNSPYFVGTQGSFATPAGTDRTKVAGFARLQAEF